VKPEIEKSVIKPLKETKKIEVFGFSMIRTFKTLT
jgi:hypothetical protein